MIKLKSIIITYMTLDQITHIAVGVVREKRTMTSSKSRIKRKNTKELLYGRNNIDLLAVRCEGTLRKTF